MQSATVVKHLSFLHYLQSRLHLIHEKKINLSSSCFFFNVGQRVAHLNHAGIIYLQCSDVQEQGS